MILHAVVRRPYAVVLLPAPVFGPPVRFFASYRGRRGARALLGQGVLEEFGTFSSPIFLAPEPLLGMIYDFGLALAAERDSEMPLHTGWPALCMGLDAPAPRPGPAWEAELRSALVAARPGGRSGEAGGLPLTSRTASVAGYGLECWSSHSTSVLATDAPLLPRQLGRLCDEIEGDLLFAYSTANRLALPEAGEITLEVEVGGEELLASLAAAARQL